MKRKYFLIFILCLQIITGCKKEENSTKESSIEETEVNNIIYKDLSIEYGNNLPNINDYLEQGQIEETEIIYKDKDDKIIKAEDLKIGVYKVFINDEEVSKLKIVDTTKPSLKLKELSITKPKYSVNDFVDSCIDNSEQECHLEFKEKEMASYTKDGTYDIVIVASDDSKNSEEKTTRLTIKGQNSKKKTTSLTITTDTKTTTSSEKTTDDNRVIDNSQNSTETIETETEEIITYKYGTKIIQKNGYYEYDYSSFNGKTDDMLNEAKSLINTNNGIYNEVLNYTNVYRSEKNLALLTLDNSLSVAATIRAIEMAYANKFSHTRPNGNSCFSVVNELGSIGWVTLGENIAYGYPTAKDVTIGWRESPGHYANMINERFTKLGVGYYKLNGIVYFVQIFGG
ncbi:MAG: CAP domain-containing protein [Bacilli bacterium]